MKEYDQDVIDNLVEGTLPWSQTKSIMSSFKDDDRFHKVLQYHQNRVHWDEKILLPIGENLFVVQKESERTVKCACGQEFGDYRINWKLEAAIFVRDTEELLQEIYPGSDVCSPEWMEIREFICPGCGVLLETEACAPGFPVTFDFCPDLEGFYREWLKHPLPEGSTKP